MATKLPQNTRTATGSFASTLRSPGGGTAFAVAFSPTAKILAVGSENVIGPGDAGTPDIQTSLWNTSTGKIVGTLIDPNTMGVTTVAFAPDGATLAVGDNNGSVYLWNIATRTLTATLTSPGSGYVAALAFSPDGATIASSTNASTVGLAYLWNVASRKLTATLNSHELGLVN